MSTTAFEARIGQSRINLAMAGIAYGLGSGIFTWLRDGSFEASNYFDELLGLAIGIWGLTIEIIKAHLRHKWTVLTITPEFIHDRRIMKRALKWDEIDWVEPNPTGMPDRIRLSLHNGIRSPLSFYGWLRCALLALLHRTPQGEVILSFGGLDRAPAQALHWMAEHRPDKAPFGWSTEKLDVSEGSHSLEGPPYIEAGPYRPYLKSHASIAIALLLLGWSGIIWLTHFSEAGPNNEVQNELLRTDLASYLVAIGLTASLGTWLWRVMLEKRMDHDMLVIAPKGIRDRRISPDWIAWDQIDRMTFAMNPSTRLYMDYVPVIIHLKPGLALARPESLYFKMLDFRRRWTMPEIVSLVTNASTTSPSEIIDMLQRHSVPVALQETNDYAPR